MRGCTNLQLSNLIRAVVGSSLPLLALPGAHALAAAGTDCGALKTAPFDHTRVISAVMVPAHAATSTPSFCEVTATVSPVPDSNIGVVYRLPDKWAGKIVGLGGGGWSGYTQLHSARGASMTTAESGLKAGYATAQTDGGHPISANFADVWRPDKWGTPEAMTDFQHRAIHWMTTVGKAVVAKYYGRPSVRAYFLGCSTGGRQGLMELQRYPEDYDGVLSMAPVYNLTVQTSALLRANVLGKPGAALTPEQLVKVNAAALKACDAQDGLADGLLDDPRRCSWDPSEMLCKAGQSGAECLTQPQVNSLRTLYDGVKTPDGRFAAWPMSRGGEISGAGWQLFVGLSGLSSDATHAGGLGVLAGPVLGNPNFNLAEFDVARDFDIVRNSAFAKAYEADDPHITAFTRRGGKLLLWHGWDDAGPSPWLTIDYYDRVNKATPDAAANVRLFMSPGVAHCAGGPGLDQFDALSTLDTWVQTGKAPEVLLATKAEPRMSRPLCAYPKVAHYKGTGDVNDAASFECR